MLAGVFAMLATATPAGATAADLLERIERYRRGDPTVLREARSEEQLRQEIEDLKRLPSGRFTTFPFEAAAMLHTDRDVEERTPHARMEEVPAAPAAHLEAARRILSLIPSDERRTRFERRWYRAVALHLYKMGQWALAEHYMKLGLALYPNDAPLLLAIGSLLETEATLDAQLVSRADLIQGPPSQKEEAREQMKATRDRLKRSESSYRMALAAEPGLLDARVRLGRVLYRSGQPGRGAEELEAVLNGTSAEAPVLYLAWLFLGAIREAEERPHDAVAAYRAALALRPASQTAGVALSHALHRLGDRAAAREALNRALSPTGGSGDRVDPWWDYPWGRAHEVEDLFESLREEARR